MRDVAIVSFAQSTLSELQVQHDIMSIDEQGQ